MAEEKKVQEKKVKCVVTNGFSMLGKLFKKGDVVELTEAQSVKFGEYKGVRPEHIYVKPFDKVTKDELANLNKVDTAPNKGNAEGKNK